jgi:catechol 2,3-dioxygenase-like lactoylglutathione lyase family enzyme
MKNMSVRFELFTNNPRKSVNFYTSILGFEELESYPDYYPIQRDNVIIGISSIDNLPTKHYFRSEITKDRKGLGIEIVFEVDNVEEEFQLFLGSIHY